MKKNNALSKLIALLLVAMLAVGSLSAVLAEANDGVPGEDQEKVTEHVTEKKEKENKDVTLSDEAIKEKSDSEKESAAEPEQEKKKNKAEKKDKAEKNEERICHSRLRQKEEIGKNR